MINERFGPEWDDALEHRLRQMLANGLADVDRDLPDFAQRALRVDEERREQAEQPQHREFSPRPELSSVLVPVLATLGIVAVGMTWWLVLDGEGLATVIAVLHTVTVAAAAAQAAADVSRRARQARRASLRRSRRREQKP